MVTAIDASSGATRWRYRSATPMLAAILPTASRLVVTADLNGDLLAFEASSGKLLDRICDPPTCGRGILAYENGGRERVAVAAGLRVRHLQDDWPTRSHCWSLDLFFFQFLFLGWLPRFFQQRLRKLGQKLIGLFFFR